jgi:hypothetical protein
LQQLLRYLQPQMRYGGYPLTVGRPQHGIGVFNIMKPDHVIHPLAFHYSLKVISLLLVAGPEPGDIIGDRFSGREPRAVARVLHEPGNVLVRNRCWLGLLVL